MATVSRGAPTRKPDTRSRILDAALQLFTEHGFEGTTLQQIADRLGFTKAALYYHFRSKDELLEALVAPAIDEMRVLLDRYGDTPLSPGRRREFVEDYVDYMLGQRALIAYMVSDLAIVTHPAVSANALERRRCMEGLLIGATNDFSEQVRVTMAFKGIGGVIAQYSDADTAELREALLDAARALLRIRPPRR